MQTTFRLCNGLTANQVKAALFVIYAHKINGQVYIGKTKDPVYRWNTHYDASRSTTNSEYNNPFQVALRNAQSAWTATEHYILAVSNCANEIRKFENIAICKYKSGLNATGHWGYSDTTEMFKPLSQWQDTVTLFRDESRDVEWGLAKDDADRDVCIARIEHGRTSPTSLVSTGKDGNFPAGYKINCSRAARKGHPVGSHVKVLVSWHASGNQLVGKKHDVFVPVNIN